MDGKYNTRSPAVKRLMREAAELSEAAVDYFAAPLEDNLFEWHFTVRGPDDTEFQGGVYHGRIILPPDYPMKPPDIVILTPNGRFEVGKKICLSISGYHPETWQPSWSIRTALLAIIGFMPTPAKSYEVGAVSYSAEERKKLAIRSQNWSCSTCACKPSSLLASDTQGRKISEEEVQDIVKTLQLKESENPDSSSPSTGVKSTSSPSQSNYSSNASTNTSSNASTNISSNASTTSSNASNNTSSNASNNTSCNGTGTTNTSSNGTTNTSQEDKSSSPTALQESEEPTRTQDLTINSGINPSEDRTIQDTREPENTGLFFGLQATDLMIAILVIVLAVLLYRRFSGQVLLLDNGEASDFSEM